MPTGRRPPSTAGLWKLPGESPEGGRPLSSFTLFTRRGRALELESRFSDALANYEEMEKLAAERDDPGL